MGEFRARETVFLIQDVLTHLQPQVLLESQPRPHLHPHKYPVPQVSQLRPHLQPQVSQLHLHLQPQVSQLHLRLQPQEYQVPQASQPPSAPGMPSVPMIDVPQAQQDAVKNQLNETINEICQQLGQKTVPGGWGWCDSNSENLHEVFEFIPSFTLVLMSREELKAYIDLEEFMGDDYQLVW